MSKKTTTLQLNDDREQKNILEGKILWLYQAELVITGRYRK